MALNLRSLGRPVYLPTVLYATGQGAIVPVVVTSAVRLGASLGVAGALAAAIGVGQIVGDLPGGWLVGRIGERRAMLVATVLLAPALVACALAPTLWLFGLGVFLCGFCGAVWGLARQTYVIENVPYELRARALSTLAGCNRVGKFLGPLAAVAAMAALDTDGAYWVHLAAAALAVAVLFTAPDIREPGRRRRAARHATVAVIRDNAAVLRTLGVSMVLLGALRAARLAVIPMWGVHIGLDATAISLVFGLFAALDMALFYPGGALMDTFGRRWVAVPSALILGMSYLLLPLTGGLLGLALVASLMGLGNGIGSGIVMTLGADVALPGARAQFLGAWRLLADIGQGAGPLAASVLLAALAPTPAVLLMGGLGLATVWSLHRWIPRSPPKRTDS